MGHHRGRWPEWRRTLTCRPAGIGTVSLGAMLQGGPQGLEGLGDAVRVRPPALGQVLLAAAPAAEGRQHGLEEGARRPGAGRGRRRPGRPPCRPTTLEARAMTALRVAGADLIHQLPEGVALQPLDRGGDEGEALDLLHLLGGTCPPLAAFSLASFSSRSSWAMRWSLAAKTSDRASRPVLACRDRPWIMASSAWSSSRAMSPGHRLDAADARR